MKGRPKTNQPNRSLEVRQVLTGEYSNLCLKLSREARKNSHLHIARWSLEKLDHFTKNMQQVWPLAQFFLFPFCKKKSLICLKGKSMTPCRGKTFLFCSSHQLPGLRLRPLKGLLSSHDALQGPLTHLGHCFQNYRETGTS